MIDAYLIDSMSVKSPTKDKWETTTATTTKRNVRCRIKRRTRTVVDFQGEDVLSSAEVLVKYSTAIEHTDLLTFDGRDHTVLAIEEDRDFAGLAKRVMVR